MRRLRIAMLGAGAGSPARCRRAETQSGDVVDLSAALAGRGHEVRHYAGQEGLGELAAFLPDVVHGHSPDGESSVPLGRGPGGGPGEPLGGPGEPLVRPPGGEPGDPLVHLAGAAPGGLPNGVRLVVTARSLDPLAVTLLGRLADRVIVRSSHHVPGLLLGGVPRRRIAAIPPGVDTSLFRPGHAMARRGRRRILTVGRLSMPEGLADLIIALRQVPAAELVIVAVGEAARSRADAVAARLIELAGHARVADRVRLLGPVAHQDMPELYRTADVLACAPRQESLGIAALEAMACGVPVAGYALGGLRDCVIDGVTGVLVRPGDKRALGVALRRLLADEVRRMSYGTAAVDRIRSRYEWPRLAADTERVYWDALADEPRPGR